MKLFDQISEPCSFRRDLTPLPFQKAKDDFERQYIDELLRYSAGNINLASQISGRDRKGLYQIMEKHSIQLSMYRPRGVKKI